MPQSPFPSSRSEIARRWWTSSDRVLASARRLAMAIEHDAYDPAQPRIPSGQFGGGRWTDGSGLGHGAGGDRIAPADRIRLADASGTPSPEFRAELKRRIDAADERLDNAYRRASSGLEISHAEIERARLAIADKAMLEIESTEWAKAVDKPPYPSGTYKCNLFVYDTLKSVESDPPLANGDRLYNWFGIGSAKYPLLAGQWGDASRVVPGWSIVTGSLEPGDVIAVKQDSANASGHTVIYVGRDHGIGRTVGAGDYTVSFTEWPFREKDKELRPVARRYRGDRRP